ncbi:MAG: acyltransferase, partial [Thermoleophilia bacterium]
AKREELPPLELGAGTIVSTGAVVFAGATVGERVVVGRGTCVENDTTIGDFTKIQSNAYITAYMTIEDHVFVAPCVQTTNDNFMGRTERRHELIRGATIRRGARVGGGVVLCPGIEIGEEAFIAAGAVVTGDAPARKVLMGVPARVVRDVPADELLENQ